VSGHLGHVLQPGAGLAKRLPYLLSHPRAIPNLDQAGNANLLNQANDGLVELCEHFSIIGGPLDERAKPR
jgi:hypothetical protein